MIAPAGTAAGLQSSHTCRQPLKPAHGQQARPYPYKTPRLAGGQGAASRVETLRPSWAAALSGTNSSVHSHRHTDDMHSHSDFWPVSRCQRWGDKRPVNAALAVIRPVLSMFSLVFKAGSVGELSIEGSTAGAQEETLHASSSSWDGDRQLRTAKSSERQSNVSEEDLVELGMFGSPHGVKGAIRLFPTTDSADERLRHAGTRWPSSLAS